MSKRVQLTFEDDQYRTLKKLALKRKESMALLVREAVATYLGQPSAAGEISSDPLLSLQALVSARGSRKTDLAEDHDSVLYGKRKP